MARALLGLLLAVATVQAQDAPWPGGVVHHFTPDGRHVYTLAGLYGNAESWARFAAYACRPSRWFAATDSLFVDAGTGTARFVSECAPADIAALMDRLAFETGILPGWEELLARDRMTPSPVRAYLCELARFHVPMEFGPLCGSWLADEDAGQIVLGHDSGMRTAQSMTPVYESRLSWTAQAGYACAFIQTNTVDRPVPASLWQSLPCTDLGIRLPGGGTGTASLNRRTGHCMAEWKYRLRVFGGDGLGLWADSSDLYGDCGLVGHDLDGDGADEVVVVLGSHDRIEIVVFGSTAR